MDAKKRHGGAGAGLSGIDQSLDGLLIQDKAVRIKLQQTDRMAANEAAYIWNYAKYPIYQNTDVVFYKEASEGIEAQKQALNPGKAFYFYGIPCD